jgi:anti-anti-sigma factor
MAEGALNGDDVLSADGLENSLVELAGSTLLVDLSGLVFMDSSGIGALVRARNRIKAGGQGDLVLTEPTALVQKALEIVGSLRGSWVGLRTGMNRDAERSYEIVVSGTLSPALIQATATDSASFAKWADCPRCRRL